MERKRAGEHVNEKDLKKHKYDVFRLLQIVTAGTKVESEGLVRVYSLSPALLIRLLFQL